MTSASKPASCSARLEVASACQRIAPADRLAIVAALAAHAEDATDANLPLMIWYAAEPCVAADTAAGVQLAANAKIPLLREFIARRIAAQTATK